MMKRNLSSAVCQAYRATGDSRFTVAVEVPILADIGKDFARYRSLRLRYPLGMLKLSNRKLRDTGFVFPRGLNLALDTVLARSLATEL